MRCGSPRGERYSPVRRVCEILLVLAALLSATSHAAQPSLGFGSVMEAAERLKAGEFIWAPEVAPRGPVLLVVSLATQRAVIYRNGVPIGISTVSTGRPGNRTPIGVFTVLERDVEHYSSLYENAPMPFMQRLTWGGVALHAGNLPGYPASHGCIRLPYDFARLLYEVTHLGMTVIVTDRPAVPRIAPADQLLRGARIPDNSEGTTWRPEAARSGPVSIVVSAADRRAVVLRNGVLVGSAPVIFQGPIDRTTAYVLQAQDGTERRWLRIPLPGQEPERETGPELRGRIVVTEEFRGNVESILGPGSTIVVTGDSLRAGGSGEALIVVDSDVPPSSR